MTVQTVAAYLQAASHPARTWRRMNRSMFGGRGGVVPTTGTFTDLQVTQRGAGANMSVDVAEGTAMVMGTESSYQGLYHCDNQGVQNVVITAANVTNPRRDLIVARIKDTEYGVAVTDAFSLEAIAGTPAGSPADPTVPDNCIVLARVAVAANATSITNANITDLRAGYAAVTGSALIGNQVKAAPSGVTPCTNAFRPTKGLYEGMMIWETDTKLAYVYNGSTWESTSMSVGGAWSGATLLNSWVNYDAINMAVAAYRKLGDIVYIRGVVKLGSSTIFTLPAGYRPLKQEIFSIDNATNAHGRVDVLANGNVDSVIGDTNGYLSLCGIQFSTSA